MCPWNEQQAYESQAGLLHVSSVIFYPEKTSFCFVVVTNIKIVGLCVLLKTKVLFVK